MSATLVVTSEIDPRRGLVQKVECANCAGAVPMQVDVARLRLVASALAETHRCTGVAQSFVDGSAVLRLVNRPPRSRWAVSA